MELGDKLREKGAKQKEPLETLTPHPNPNPLSPSPSPQPHHPQPSPLTAHRSPLTFHPNQEAMEAGGTVRLVRTISQTADTTVKANVELVRHPTHQVPTPTPNRHRHPNPNVTPCIRRAT